LSPDIRTNSAESGRASTGSCFAARCGGIRSPAGKTTNRLADRCSRWRGRGPDLCPHGRGTAPPLRHPSQPQDAAAGIDHRPAQAPAPLPYLDASRVGWRSVRLPTWFPFPVHLYLHGREWLAQQMDRAGIGYRRHDNCFTGVEDVERAQRRLQEQLKTNGVQSFAPLVRQVHPLLFSELCRNYPMKYFWNGPDREWATDLIFCDPQPLRRLVPRLLHWGVVSSSSPDVLRFMGKMATRQGNAAGGQLPLRSDLKVRSNGARIKHRLGPNSIKLYAKACDELGAVLRAEVTIAQPQYFPGDRRTEDPNSALAWRPMRQRLADLHHRAAGSQARAGVCERFTPSLPTIAPCSRPSIAASAGATAAFGRHRPEAAHASRPGPDSQTLPLPPLRGQPQRPAHPQRPAVGPSPHRPANQRDRSMSTQISSRPEKNPGECNTWQAEAGVPPACPTRLPNRYKLTASGRRNGCAPTDSRAPLWPEESR